MSKIGVKNPKMYSRIRSTIETAYLRNNVTLVTTLAEAYELAKKEKGTIVTDLPIYKAKEMGLPNEAKVLIFNDGIITGRQANARKLINKSNHDKYANILRNSVFNSRYKKSYIANNWD